MDLLRRGAGFFLLGVVLVMVGNFVAYLFDGRDAGDWAGLVLFLAGLLSVLTGVGMVIWLLIRPKPKGTPSA